MSLINDALKRAQQDKASKPAATPPFLPAVSSSNPPAVSVSNPPAVQAEADSKAAAPADSSPVPECAAKPAPAEYVSLSAASDEVAPSRLSAADPDDSGGDVPVGVWAVGPRMSLDMGTGNRMLALSAAALVLLVCGLAWMWSQSDRPGHVTASVAPQSQPEPEPLATGTLADDAELVSQTISSQLNDAAGSAAGDSSAPLFKISGDSSGTAHLVGAVPATPPAVVSGDAAGLAVQALGSAGSPSAGGSKTTVILPRPVVAPESTNRPVAVPASSTSRPDTNSAAGATRSEASKFTLGGIVRIGGEAMATINGKLVRVGDTVDGGRVLAIESQSVEIESAGQKFSLRM